jgi:hypothetical protein
MNALQYHGLIYVVNILPQDILKANPKLHVLTQMIDVFCSENFSHFSSQESLAGLKSLIKLSSIHDKELAEVYLKEFTGL